MSRWCEVGAMVFNLAHITNFDVIEQNGIVSVKARLAYHVPHKDRHMAAFFIFGDCATEDECRQLIRDVIAGKYDLKTPSK